MRSKHLLEFPNAVAKCNIGDCRKHSRVAITITITISLPIPAYTPSIIIPTPIIISISSHDVGSTYINDVLPKIWELLDAFEKT